MHCHCGTNNRAPRWTFTDPCKPEVRPGAREESASPAWLAAPAMNARDTAKVYIWRLDTGCGPTLYRKCHSHNTSGKFKFVNPPFIVRSFFITCPFVVRFVRIGSYTLHLRSVRYFSVTFTMRSVTCLLPVR